MSQYGGVPFYLKPTWRFFSKFLHISTMYTYVFIGNKNNTNTKYKEDFLKMAKHSSQSKGNISNVDNLIKIIF